MATFCISRASDAARQVSLWATIATCKSAAPGPPRAMGRYRGRHRPVVRSTTVGHAKLSACLPCLLPALWLSLLLEFQGCCICPTLHSHQMFLGKGPCSFCGGPLPFGLYYFCCNECQQCWHRKRIVSVAQRRDMSKAQCFVPCSVITRLVWTSMSALQDRGTLGLQQVRALRRSCLPE